MSSNCNQNLKRCSKYQMKLGEGDNLRPPISPQIQATYAE